MVCPITQGDHNKANRVPLPWAWVQPTMDPNAEAFCKQAQSANPGGAEFG